MSDLLTEADEKSIEQYAAEMKRQIISRLKENKADEMREAVERKLMEEMVQCATEFFAAEIKEDMLKQFASQKNLILSVGTEAIAAIADAVKTQLVKMVTERMERTYDAKKVIGELFGVTF